MFSPIFHSQKMIAEQLHGDHSIREKITKASGTVLGKVVDFTSSNSIEIVGKMNQELKNILTIRREFIKLTADHRNELESIRSDPNAIDKLKELKSQGKIADRLTVENRSPIAKKILIIYEKKFKMEKSKEQSAFAKKLEKEIKRNIDNLNNPSLGEEEKNEIVKSIKFDRALLKTLELSDFKKIAQGKAKQVFINAKLPESAFYRPVNDLSEKIFKSRTKEIEEEMEIGKSIEGKISDNIREKFHIEAGKLHLATHMELKEVDGERVYQTARADGDLEKLVNAGELKFPQSRDLAFKMLKGMAILHATGYVHGDLKLENVLYKKEDNGEIDVMIADFGKTTALGSDERKIHMGNNRYQDPNGGLSQRAEIYSVALMMIRVLEGELIGEVEPGSDRDMLLHDLSNLDQKRATDKRHGVEKFLVSHRDCPQTENMSIRGKVRAIELEATAAAKIKSSYDLDKSEEAIHSYIDALREGLKASHPESEWEEIDAISDLLKEMTRSKVDSSGDARTKTLESAYNQFSTLLTK